VTGKSRHARSGGFTRIEVLIVMALIVILASTGLALYTNSVTRTKEAVLREDLVRMRDAISQYYADRNNYPATLQSLVDDKYLRSVPVDPFTDSSDTWQVVMSDPDPSNPTAEIGVFDVKSGSDRTALDGSPYNDW
jgi:general secretion pathway protein G